LIANFPACSQHMQLICWSSGVGLFEIAVLVGAGCLVLACLGTKRRYGLVIISLLALLHFYALLSMQIILGPVHVISTPYLMWAFFPLSAPAAIAAGAFAAKLVLGQRTESSVWALVAASSVIAIVVALAPGLPHLSPHVRRGLPSIAHIAVDRGPIVNY